MYDFTSPIVVVNDNIQSPEKINHFSIEESIVVSLDKVKEKKEDSNKITNTPLKNNDKNHDTNDFSSESPMLLSPFSSGKTHNSSFIDLMTMTTTTEIIEKTLPKMIITMIVVERKHHQQQQTSIQSALLPLLFFSPKKMIDWQMHRDINWILDVHDNLKEKERIKKEMINDYVKTKGVVIQPHMCHILIS
jgi:hypothetical protein